MLALSFSAAMLGIEGYVVRVEADSAAGTPAFVIIGLPDRALGEARERVRAAIINSGFAYPAGRLLVNLSPAEVRKAGPAFDLAIALALMAIDEQIDRLALRDFIALGELALDGKLQPVGGILPMVLGARDAGFTKLIVPERNGAGALPRRRLSLRTRSFTGIWQTFAASWPPNARSRLLPQAAIICSWSDRPVVEKRCWLGACPPFCRPCPCTKRWKSRRSTASRDCFCAARASFARGRFDFRITRSAKRR